MRAAFIMLNKTLVVEQKAVVVVVNPEYIVTATIHNCNNVVMFYCCVRQVGVNVQANGRVSHKPGFSNLYIRYVRVTRPNRVVETQLQIKKRMKGRK